MLLAVASFSTLLAAQPSGWPPSKALLTLPVWPGVAPGAPATMPKRT